MEDVSFKDIMSRFWVPLHTRVWVWEVVNTFLAICLVSAWCSLEVCFVSSGSSSVVVCGVQSQAANFKSPNSSSLTPLHGMPLKKTYSVTLKLPQDFLSSVKVAPAAAKPKTRVKKLSKEKKTGTMSPGSSPAPTDDTQGKGTVNTGPKELSTAGLTVNSISQTLDKSGRPCRRWTRAPIQFKTFSGFKISIDTWKQSLETQTPEVGEGSNGASASEGDALSIKAEEAVTT